jgi:hypothetical protein
VVSHTWPMHSLVALSVLFVLAACSGDPRSYGITGPGTQAVTKPEPARTGDSAMPGVPTTGTYYGPTTAPVTGSSGFWGYN